MNSFSSAVGDSIAMIRRIYPSHSQNTKIATRCVGCDAAGLTSVLDLGQMPLANAILPMASSVTQEPHFPLELCFLLQMLPGTNLGTRRPGGIFLVSIATIRPIPTRWSSMLAVWLNELPRIWPGIPQYGDGGGE